MSFATHVFFKLENLLHIYLDIDSWMCISIGENCSIVSAQADTVGRLNTIVLMIAVSKEIHFTLQAMPRDELQP